MLIRSSLNQLLSLLYMVFLNNGASIQLPQKPIKGIDKTSPPSSLGVSLIKPSTKNPFSAKFVYSCTNELSRAILTVIFSEVLGCTVTESLLNVTAALSVNDFPYNKLYFSS